MYFSTQVFPLMNYKSLFIHGALSLLVSSAAMLAVLPAQAQGQSQGEPNVSVVHLQVQPGANGQQMVLTPRGMLVPLPGAGVNSNVAEIYMGQNGGYWYVDKNGQTEDLTNYVQQLKARAGQFQTATPPQNMPYAAPQTTNNTTNNYNSGGSGAGTAVATAAAAGLGAMAGSAMSGMYYNNVPYGTPLYYGANGRPYYNNNGNNVFVNDNGDVNWNNVAAANNMHNYNQEQKASQVASYQNQNQQERQQSMSSNQQARQAAYAPQQPDYGAQSQRFQQQQQYYQSQMQNKGERAQSWQQSSGGENPFVRQQGEGGGRFGGGAAQGEGAGRFGGGAAQGEGGGRFGGGAAQGEGGGRFGGGEGGSRFGGGEGGGRFGGGEGGGRFGGGAGGGGGRLGGRRGR